MTTLSHDSSENPTYQRKKAPSDNWWSGGNTAWGGYDKKDEKMSGAYKDWAMSNDNYHWGKFVDENKSIQQGWESNRQEGYGDKEKWEYGKDYYSKNSGPKQGSSCFKYCY